MPTDTTTSDRMPPSPQGTPDGSATVLPDELRAWVSGAAANGWTKEQVRAWLYSSGWSGPATEVAMAEFVATAPPAPFNLRPPRPERANKHGLAYGVLFWSLGLAALSAGSSLHLILEAAFRDEQASWVLANWLTLFVCTIPFFLFARREVTKIEREDPLARLSTTRDTLGLTLLWAAALVGILRLLVFVHQAITSLVVDRSADDLLPNLAHVSVVVLLAGGVYLWTWTMRHPGTFGTPNDEEADGGADEHAVS
jgi:hypothetical protein